MESCITNRLNSLCVLYCNLEKKVNDYLSKNYDDSIIKEEFEKIKGELREIKEENNLSIERELEIVNGELKIIKNDKNYKIKEELDIIKNTINSITRELRHQKNVNLESTPNYLEYTLLYSLYMTLSYINSRTINHVVIYSYTQTLKIVVSVCIVQVSHMNLIMIYQVVPLLITQYMII